jgi:YVTN family beta-propeller protein
VTSITCGLLLCSGPNNPPQVTWVEVEVIDTNSYSLKATVVIGNIPTQNKPGVLPSGVAISPDGTLAYVVNAVGGQIWGIDTASNQVVATMTTLASGLIGVSVSPDGSRLTQQVGGARLRGVCLLWMLSTRKPSTWSQA